MDSSQLRLDSKGDTPLYVQLSEAFCRLIQSGQLLPGDQLPSERKLAKSLQVSRTTTLNAYRELEARGLVRSYVGQGTFVSGRPEDNGNAFVWQGKVTPAVQQLTANLCGLISPHYPEHIPFGAGAPAADVFPSERYASIVHSLLTQHSHSMLSLSPSAGHPQLRDIIAQREGVAAKQVLVSAGAQQALDLLARCLLQPHDHVVMEAPGYVGAMQSFRLSGAQLHGWDILRADLDELEDLFLKKRPKLLYLNPSFHNPSGRTMSLEMRYAVLELARRYRVPILEDETYRQLYFHRPPPTSFKDLEHGGVVIHVCSFAKNFAPSLRLGYVIADEAIIEQLTRIRAQSDVACPTLSQISLAEMMHSGDFDQHVVALRREHQRRAQAMESALQRYVPSESLRWEMPQGGLYFWCHLRQGDSRSFAQHALGHQVSFAAGDIFYPNGTGLSMLRLCFARNHPEHIDQGIRRIAAALATWAPEPIAPFR